MPTVSDVINKRLNGYKPGDHVAVAIWCEDDVIGRAQERGKRVTREQAQRILDRIDNKQDCTQGISWVEIDIYTDEDLEETADEQLPEKPCLDGSIAI